MAKEDSMVWAILDPVQNEALKELIYVQESDRIVAILGGALLDDSLRHVLEQRLRQKDGNTDINEKLFRPGGPLGNLQPKIDLGYQLYMLDKEHRNAMYGLAEIRNLFAHNLAMKFSDAGEKMKTAVAKLRLHETRDSYPSPIASDKNKYPIEPANSVKDKFIVNLKFCLLWLMIDLNKHHAFCNVPVEYVHYESLKREQPFLDHIGRIAGSEGTPL
jgi:hypothetical protein